MPPQSAKPRRGERSEGISHLADFFMNHKGTKDTK
jgi:hypothetical protein